MLIVINEGRRGGGDGGVEAAELANGKSTDAANKERRTALAQGENKAKRAPLWATPPPSSQTRLSNDNNNNNNRYEDVREQESGID